jgi:hypothetical protein
MGSVSIAIIAHTHTHGKISTTSFAVSIQVRGGSSWALASQLSLLPSSLRRRLPRVPSSLHCRRIFAAKDLLRHVRLEEKVLAAGERGGGPTRPAPCLRGVQRTAWPLAPVLFW